MTVLFASYNNVPINNVFEKLSSLTYKGKRVAFPVLRLGNQEKVKECICYINQLRREVQGIKVFSSTLDRRKGDRIDRAKQLSGRLKEYEEVLDLTERKETLTQVMEYQERMKNVATLFHFHTDLQGRQLRNLDEKIQKIGEISERDAMALLDRNEDEFYSYLYYTSAKYIKELESNRFQDLRKILDDDEDVNEQAAAFNLSLIHI